MTKNSKDIPATADEGTLNTVSPTDSSADQGTLNTVSPTQDFHWWQPAPGCRVRKPGGALIAEAGEALPFNSYYARLIADGDLVPVSGSNAA